MRTETGTCKYCKQIRVIEVPDDMLVEQKDLDISATDNCDCPSASWERKRQEKLMLANNKIQELVPFDTEPARNLREVLMLTANMLTKGEIENLSIKNGSSKISMKTTSTGGIKIEKKTTKTEGGEV